jgi:hypothetical protein
MNEPVVVPEEKWEELRELQRWMEERLQEGGKLHLGLGTLDSVTLPSAVVDMLRSAVSALDDGRGCALIRVRARMLVQ